MKKSIALGFYLFVVLCLGLAAYINYTSEDNQSNFVAGVNQVLDENAVPAGVEIESVESGFFSSESRVLIEIDESSAKDDKSSVVPMILKTYHGPMMLTEHGIKFGLNYLILTPELDALMEPDERDALRSAFGEQIPIQFGLLIGFGETLNGYVEIPPFHYVDETAGAVIELDEGIAMSVSTDDQFSMMKAQVEIGALAVDEAAKDMHVSISKSQLLIDMTEIYAGTMLAGTIEYHLSEAGIEQSGRGFSLSNLDIVGRSDNSDGDISGVSSITIDEIAMTPPDLIPMLEGPYAFNMSMNYSGIDTGTMKKIADQSQKANQQLYLSLLSGDLDAIATDEFAENQAQTYLLMAEIIERGFEFDYKLALTNPAGGADLSLDFSWVDSEGLVQKQTVGEVLNSFRSHAVLSVKKTLIENTPFKDMLEAPVSMGYAVDGGDEYLSTLDFDAGVLRLNDKPIPYLDNNTSVTDQPLPWR